MEKHTRKNIYNGSPLQYSCLENPRDGGAWRAAVCGVEESDSTEAARQQQMRNCLALLYNRNKHNTVSQLYFNKILFFKVFQRRPTHCHLGLSNDKYRLLPGRPVGAYLEGGPPCAHGCIPHSTLLMSQGFGFYCSHLTDEETKAPGVFGNTPKVTQLQAENLGLERSSVWPLSPLLNATSPSPG